MELKDFKEQLETVCDKVYHFNCAGKQEFPSIIFAETGRKYEHYDNMALYPHWVVDVHVYTRTEYDDIVMKLEKMFNKNRISVEEGKVDYGHSTENAVDVIYYKFTCEF